MTPMCRALVHAGARRPRLSRPPCTGGRGPDAHGAVVEPLVVQDVGVPVGAAVVLAAVGTIRWCQFPVDLPRLGRVRGLLVEDRVQVCVGCGVGVFPGRAEEVIRDDPVPVMGLAAQGGPMSAAVPARTALTTAAISPPAAHRRHNGLATSPGDWSDHRYGANLSRGFWGGFHDRLRTCAGGDRCGGARSASFPDPGGPS